MTAVDPTSTNLLRSYSFNGSDSQIIDASGNGSPIVINNSNIAQEIYRNKSQPHRYR